MATTLKPAAIHIISTIIHETFTFFHKVIDTLVVYYHSIYKKRKIMKVFVPVTDEMLRSKQAIHCAFVPFQPEFLKERSSSSVRENKPANWISNDDYASACKRLKQGRVG